MSKSNPRPPLTRIVEDNNEEEASCVSGDNSVMFEYNVRFAKVENQIKDLRDHLNSVSTNMAFISGNVKDMLCMYEPHYSFEGEQQPLTAISPDVNDITTSYQIMQPPVHGNTTRHDDMSSMTSQPRRPHIKPSDIFTVNTVIQNFTIFMLVYSTLTWVFAFSGAVTKEETVLFRLPVISIPLCALTSYYSIRSILQGSTIDSLFISTVPYVLIVASYIIRIIKKSEEKKGTVNAYDLTSSIMFFVLGIINFLLVYRYNKNIQKEHEPINEPNERDPI